MTKKKILELLKITLYAPVFSMEHKTSPGRFPYKFLFSSCKIYGLPVFASKVQYQRKSRLALIYPGFNEGNCLGPP